MPDRRWVQNPFYVLALPPDAQSVEVERAAKKWLGMLELGLREAASYLSPFGEHERTPELVRTAQAALQDPARRLQAECWARVDAGDVLELGDPEAFVRQQEEFSPSLAGALAVFGWTGEGQ